VTVGPDGQPTVDYAALLPDVDAATLFEVKKTVDESAQRMATLQTANLTREQKTAEYVGGLGRAIAAAKYHPDAFGLAITTARRAGVVTQAQADQLLAEAAADPAAIQRYADAAIAQAGGEDKLQKITTVDAQGNPVEQFVVPREGATYAQAPKNVSLQQKDVLLDGRPAIVSFDPGSGKSWVETPAGRVDVSARVRPIPPQGPQPSYQWAVPPGGKTPVLMSAQEIRGSGATSPSSATVKPPTGVEARALGFFSRMDQADKDLEAQEDNIANLGLGGQMWRGVMPNAAQSDESQQYSQAEQAFATAYLRKDSGAQISDKEMADGRKTYFVVPGDGPAVIAQKRRARAALAAAMAVESGNALVEDVGDEEQAKAIIAKYKERAQRPQPGRLAGYKVGDTVTVNGQRLKITEVLPNGKFKGVPVQ